MGSLSVLSVAQGFQQGLPIKVVAGIIKPIYLIATRPEVGSLNDLKGKRFAFAAPQAESTVMVEEMLASKGLTAKDYTRLQIGGSGPELPLCKLGQPKLPSFLIQCCSLASQSQV